MKNDMETAAADSTVLAVPAVNAETRDRKRVKIFEYDIGYIFLAMILGAFFGFLAENAGRLATKGIIDSRHQILPFLFAYGIAVLAMYIMLGTPDKMHVFGKRLFKENTKKNKLLSNLIYFAVVFVFVFFGEIAVGTLYEKFTGVVLWNYSNIALHLTKYTSIPTTIMYGGGAFLLMKFGFTPFMNMLQNKMNYKAALAIDFSLGTLIVIDFLIMVILICVTNTAPEYWSIMI